MRTHAPSAPAGPSDEALVRLAQGGDRDALAALLTRSQDRIFAVCLRMVGGGQETARDLAQDAMVKIIHGLASFDGRASFATWMTRVVMNLCLSHLRGQKLRRHVSLDAPVNGAEEGSGGGKTPLWAVTADPRSLGRDSGTTGAISGWEPDAPAGVQRREDFERLQRCLQRLDPDQRAILILRDVRDLDYAQIADVLEIAVGTVKSRLFRARAALRELIESEESGGPPAGAPGRR